MYNKCSLQMISGIHGAIPWNMRVNNNGVAPRAGAGIETIHSVHSRAHGQHPCTPLHTLHTPYSMRVSGGRTPAQTPAHPCTRVIYPLCHQKKR